MGEDERLRLDYNQTTELVRTLMDVRFKLLAFVPTIAGAGVAVVGHGAPTGGELLGVGILGLLATFGVLLYDLRNTQVYNATLARARALERLFAPERPGLAELLAQAPATQARPFGLAGDIPNGGRTGPRGRSAPHVRGSSARNPRQRCRNRGGLFVEGVRVAKGI